MSHEEDIDARLARLASATQGITPSAGFNSRVMQRIGDEPAPTLVALRAPAFRFFPIGMLAAALALFWAVSVDGEVTEAMAASDDLELSW